jgi:regulator of nonsense transcripts 2
MISQKEAEKAEQQRIKNLVLNYDLQDTPDHDGTSYFNSPNPNFSKRSLILSVTHTYNRSNEGLGGGDKHGASHHQHNASLHQSAPTHTNAKPADKSGTNRGHRARRLQLSDVDWYEPKPEPNKPGSSLFARGRGSGRRPPSYRKSS